LQDSRTIYAGISEFGLANIMYTDAGTNFPGAPSAWGTINNCIVCNRLWKEFQRLNADLLKLVEQKYAEGRSNILLEREIRQMGEERQRAKTSILEHEQDCAENSPEEKEDCEVCGGTGRRKQVVKGRILSYVQCPVCGGSGQRPGPADPQA